MVFFGGESILYFETMGTYFFQFEDEIILRKWYSSIFICFRFLLVLVCFGWNQWNEVENVIILKQSAVRVFVRTEKPQNVKSSWLLFNLKLFIAS